MVKTTIYLDLDLALAIRNLAVVESRTQAELIRSALVNYTQQHKPMAIPGVGEFDSSASDTSQKAEQLLRKASAAGKWRRQSSRGKTR